MTVYVDDMRACHMIADTDDELHAMADRIGVARKWHQSPPKASHSHYDICLSKRAQAVAAGAIEITWKQAACMAHRRRVTGELGSPEDAVEWIRHRQQGATHRALDAAEMEINPAGESAPHPGVADADARKRDG